MSQKNENDSLVTGIILGIFLGCIFSILVATAAWHALGGQVTYEKQVNVSDFVPTCLEYEIRTTCAYGNAALYTSVGDNPCLQHFFAELTDRKVYKECKPGREVLAR